MVPGLQKIGKDLIATEAVESLVRLTSAFTNSHGNEYYKLYDESIFSRTILIFIIGNFFWDIADEIEKRGT